MNELHVRNVIEAALLAAGRPLQASELLQLFDASQRPASEELHAAIRNLTAQYVGRGIEIHETAAGFRVQVRKELANEISRLWPERPARYSRALLETLALIAYRQPITRAEIEAVRGVAVNPNILKTMFERNWIRVVGHRDVPGRPELLGTTREFLDYFNLRSLDELPPLADLKSLGDIRMQFDLPDGESDAPQFGVPGPGNAGAQESGTGSHDAAGAEACTDARPPIDPGHGGGELQAGVAGPTDLPGAAATAAEQFAASVEVELASGDDEPGDDEELSAADPGARELVAGPHGMDN